MKQRKQNKEKVYLMGVEEYNQSSKTIIFDRAFGFRLDGQGNIGPMLISSFDIKYVDVFGSAYYNGTWKGVRMIGKD